MPAKVKLISVTVGSNDKDGNPAARVGDNIQIQVQVDHRLPLSGYPDPSFRRHPADLCRQEVVAFQ